MAKVALLELVRGLQPDATEAELVGWIMRGAVLVNEQRITHPGAPVKDTDSVRIVKGPRYASRGGEKLDAALDAWDIQVPGGVFIDAGSSSGGFTHCLLDRGALQVYCVDVGYGLLSYALRSHPGTTVLERTNVMQLGPVHLPRQPDAAVCDLSFRSLRGAAAHLLSLVTDRWVIALVKPQFEWLSPPPEFRGVVREIDQRRSILIRLFGDLRGEGVHTRRVLQSPVHGRRGNTEYLALLSGTPGDEGAVDRELEVALLE